MLGKYGKATCMDSDWKLSTGYSINQIILVLFLDSRKCTFVPLLLSNSTRIGNNEFIQIFNLLDSLLGISGDHVKMHAAHPPMYKLSRL